MENNFPEQVSEDSQRSRQRLSTWQPPQHREMGAVFLCASRGSSPAPGELLALIPGVNFPVSYVLLTGLKWKQRADMVAEGTVEVLLGLSRENGLESRRRPDLCTLQFHLTPAWSPGVSPFASGFFIWHWESTGVVGSYSVTWDAPSCACNSVWHTGPQGWHCWQLNDWEQSVLAAEKWEVVRMGWRSWGLT